MQAGLRKRDTVEKRSDYLENVIATNRAAPYQCWSSRGPAQSICQWCLDWPYLRRENYWGHQELLSVSVNVLLSSWWRQTISEYQPREVRTQCGHKIARGTCIQKLSECIHLDLCIICFRGDASAVWQMCERNEEVMNAFTYLLNLCCFQRWNALIYKFMRTFKHDDISVAVPSSTWDDYIVNHYNRSRLPPISYPQGRCKSMKPWPRALQEHEALAKKLVTQCSNFGDCLWSCKWLGLVSQEQAERALRRGTRVIGIGCELKSWADLSRKVCLPSRYSDAIDWHYD